MGHFPPHSGRNVSAITFSRSGGDRGQKRLVPDTDADGLMVRHCRWSMDRPPIRINLEVQPGADPIQGSFRVHDDAPQPFWGWLQLSSLLLGAVDGPTEPTGGADR